MFNNLFMKPLFITILGLSICYFIDKYNNDKSNQSNKNNTNKYITICLSLFSITFFISMCTKRSTKEVKEISKSLSGGGNDCCPF